VMELNEWGVKRKQELENENKDKSVEHICIKIIYVCMYVYQKEISLDTIVHLTDNW
jgi:hypothetical protein